MNTKPTELDIKQAERAQALGLWQNAELWIWEIERTPWERIRPTRKWVDSKFPKKFRKNMKRVGPIPSVNQAWATVLEFCERPKIECRNSFWKLRHDSNPLGAAVAMTGTIPEGQIKEAIIEAALTLAEGQLLK